MLLLHRASQATTEFKRVTAIKHVTNDSSPPTKLLHFFFKLTFLISITRVPKENPYILEITLITSARKNLILQPLLPLALQLPLFARKPLLHREHNLLRFTSFSQWENKQFLFPEKWGLPSSVMTILMGKRKPKWNLLRIFQFDLEMGYLYYIGECHWEYFHCLWHHPVSLFGEIYSYFCFFIPYIPHFLVTPGWILVVVPSRTAPRSLSLNSREKASIFTREIIALWKTKCRYTPSKKSSSSHFLPLNLLPNGWCNTSFFSQPGSKDFAILKWCWKCVA